MSYLKDNFLLTTKTAEKLSEAEFMLLPADSTYVIPIFTVTAVISGIFLIIYSERRKALISSRQIRKRYS